jgi:hypothetical protein
MAAKKTNAKKSNARKPSRSARVATAAAGGYIFANPQPTPDDYSGFSQADLDADSDVKAAEHLEPFPASRKPEVMSLDQVIGTDPVALITTAKSITFHCVGDTGGIKEPSKQFAVADAMANDLAGKNYQNGLPAFFYHLGDVVPTATTTPQSSPSPAITMA